MNVHAPASPRIEQVRTAASPTVGQTLARAMADDPVTRWMIRRESRLEPGFDFHFQRVWLPQGAVYQTADRTGVACWLPPGTAQMSMSEQLRLLPRLALMLGRDLPRFMSGITLMEKNHPPEPHWYLDMIGVQPSGQGRGLGSALLAHTLQRVDADGMPAYLEATTERSLPLYERHGFEVTDEVRLPKGGPPLWRMWREPTG